MIRSLISFFTILLACIVLAKCQQEINWPQVNKLPVAKAGDDKLVTLPVNSVALDASNSSDPDGQIVLYTWTVISGPPSYVFTDGSARQTQLQQLVEGIYKVELMVTDNLGLSDKDTLNIIVQPAAVVNRPPVAITNDDQTIVLPNNTVVISGTGSFDPDNNINGYSWTKIAGPASYNIINVNSAVTNVTNLTEGVYLFELKVTDTGGLFGKDTLKATVLR